MSIWVSNEGQLKYFVIIMFQNIPSLTLIKGFLLPKKKTSGDVELVQTESDNEVINYTDILGWAKAGALYAMHIFLLELYY